MDLIFDFGEKCEVSRAERCSRNTAVGKIQVSDSDVSERIQYALAIGSGRSQRIDIERQIRSAFAGEHRMEPQCVERDVVFPGRQSVISVVRQFFIDVVIVKVGDAAGLPSLRPAAAADPLH